MLVRSAPAGSRCRIDSTGAEVTLSWRVHRSGMCSDLHRSLRSLWCWRVAARHAARASRHRARTPRLMAIEEPATWMVPGTPLAAWSGPDGSSFVVYRTLWVPEGSAEMLAEALGNRLENLPGLKLLVKRTETVAGVPAARVEVIAPGTGDALAASGLGEPIEPPGKTLIPTRQVTLAFTRPCRHDLPHLAHAGRLLRSDRAGYPGHAPVAAVRFELAASAPRKQ